MLVLLGDSTAVGIGDPVSGGWRGFGPLLSSAFGGDYRNFALSGARIADVRRTQLPSALRLQPSAAVVIAGVNDTLRSDFDTRQLHSDLDQIVGSLSAAGTSVVTVRFHDQGRVFKLPGRLRRVLGERITALNEIIDVVVARHGAKCVDLHLLPGAYELPTWAVDRLHPSELGHRMLARAFAAKLVESGHDVGQVSLECSGGRELTIAHHVAWLLVKGIPWLWRRGSDLAPLLWSHDIPGEARSPVTGGGGGAVAGEALRADTGR
ncbi:SGNH/GDSL hydrolase family protein [Lentzea tibetensis]|uniref:SGNH/GDSL hydrolase family protein n=1 Tax=Lentzea tibetensis TaxID=2591470 RepID=UPI001F4112B8|nr:SGNH/GDSL hydrolase family protein [Lentzea tibetensis]